VTVVAPIALFAAAAGGVHWPRALIYLVGTVVLARVVDFLLARQGGGLSRFLRRELTVAEKTRLRMVRRLAVFGILFVGIAFALVQLPQVGTLARGMLASAGITALVVGLAARSVLANLVSGIIIAFSQPVRIGDYISVDDVQGTVEEIGLTYSYIRTCDERRLVIPNDLFASKVIHNYSIVDPLNAVEVDLVLPATTDLESVRRAALEEAGRAAPALEGHPPSVEVVAQTLDSVTIRLTVWITDPALRLGTERALRLAALQRLAAAGVMGGPAPAGA
jgi:small conductance mechanosensitive channel